MNEITIPEGLRVEAGDEYAKFYFEPVDGAAGYRLSFYREQDDENRFKSRIAEKPGKIVRGFKNGITYYVSICAFVRDEECREIFHEESERIPFTPEGSGVKVPKKICLRSGDIYRFELDSTDDLSYPEFESNNPDVASVDDVGCVTALRFGEADINVTFHDGTRKTTSISVDRNYSKYENSHGRIIITGDLMCNAWLQKKAAPHNYEFGSSLKKAAERFQGADHVIGNLETVTYDNAPYEWEQLRTSTGGPNCNSPSTFLKALKNAGYDVLVTANNHNMDCGSEGLKETISLIKRNGMANSGTGYENPVFFYTKGIKVALISLTMAVNSTAETVSDSSLMTGRYSEEYCKKLLKEAKDAAAEYVIVYMHWGAMNSYGVTDAQRIAAHFIAENGADLIVGSHPHLIQRADVITTSTGKKVTCAYSLGNFMSTMKEVTGNRDSVALVVDLVRDEPGVESFISYIPFYSRILKNDVTVEPIDYPLGFEQTEAKDRIGFVIGEDIPMLKPKIKCFGSVILRRIFSETTRYDADIDHILLSPASLTGEPHPEYAHEEYPRINADILKDDLLIHSGDPNEYVMLDFYAAASLRLLKRGDTYYTDTDAFRMSSFYTEHEREFTMIDQPDATDIVTSYIEELAKRILEHYDHNRIILLRSRIPSVSVCESTYSKGKKTHSELNKRIEWLEDLFIIYTDPIIIDISRDYFADNTETDSVSEYEEYYYKDVLRNIDRITAGDITRCYKKSDADLWFRRMLKYYDHALDCGDWDTICIERDAASALIQNAPRPFIVEHSREIIYMREQNIADLADVPFIEYMSDDIKDMAISILEAAYADMEESDQD